MRSKEEAHDYRYFPDPDLLPLELDRAFVDELRARTCPNCRTTRRRASSRDYGLAGYDADVLVAERETADFFEAVVRKAGRGRDAKAPPTGCINDLFGRLNKEGKRHRRLARCRAAAARRHPRPDRRRHDLRQDRQGPVRDRLERGRRSRARSSRAAA